MDGRQTTRRHYLLGVGSLGAAGLAGCVQDSGESTEDGTEAKTESGTETGAGAGTADGTETGGETATEESDGGAAGDPDFGGYLDDANNYGGSVVDERGTDEVTVAVGAGDNGFAFDPAAVHVDNGATVVWEWTGEGGSHSVVNEEGVFDSGSPAESGPYEHTFEEDGVYLYFCRPHKGAGMKGAVVVGTDYLTKDAGSGDEQATGPDFGGYLDDANNYRGSVVDRTDGDETTVDVGAGEGFAFGPAAIEVTPGTAVTWEWTGEGGAHTVTAEDGTFDSGDAKSSGTYEYTFTDTGVYTYFCRLHEGVGMKGAVVVTE